jgi:hypothetical protein
MELLLSPIHVHGSVGNHKQTYHEDLSYNAEWHRGDLLNGLLGNGEELDDINTGSFASDSVLT